MCMHVEAPLFDMFVVSIYSPGEEIVPQATIFVATAGLTVTLALPTTLALVAFTRVVPCATAVKFPEASIVPTDVLLLDQTTSAVISIPSWSLGEAVKV